MGAKSTGALAVFVGAVAIFGSVRLSGAQNFPGRNPLTLRMPDDASGVDVKAVVTIAIRLGVPLGFEEAGALDDRVKGPFHPLGPARERPIVRVRPTPLDVRGVTLREALDAVIAKDRRYAWKAIDGVVVVRPVAAWRDPFHPLLRPMTEVEAPGLAGSAEWTLLDRLNATARARGGFHWILAPSSSLVLLDRGRAVEVAEPVLRFGDDSGETVLSLR